MMPRPRRQLTIAKPAELTADRLHADRDMEFLPHPLDQIDQSPADHPMDGRYRAALDHRRQRAPLRVAHARRRTWRTAVDQAVGAMRIEARHLVPDNLQTNTTTWDTTPSESLATGFGISPYTRSHILRFGQYALDMDNLPEPLDPQPLPFEQAL